MFDSVRMHGSVRLQPEARHQTRRRQPGRQCATGVASLERDRLLVSICRTLAITGGKRVHAKGACEFAVRVDGVAMFLAHRTFRPRALCRLPTRTAKFRDCASLDGSTGKPSIASAAANCASVSLGAIFGTDRSPMSICVRRLLARRAILASSASDTFFKET